MYKVLVVGGDHLIELMFLKRGWELCREGDTPTLVQFTGGEDVSPTYYGEDYHPATYANPTRDEWEMRLFQRFKAQGIPMAGICRGGQFLNVASGGGMWQHVDRHGGDHMAEDAVFNKEVLVTSTHHQMMRPSPLAQILLTASPRRSTFRQDGFGNSFTEGHEDIEAVFYEHSKALCYQPHPEYVEYEDECQNLYFDYLEKFLNLRA